MALLQSTLPALSLAMKAHASHEIGSALLRTYLGQETGDAFMRAQSSAVPSRPSMRCFGLRTSAALRR
jgi:hypothetical protein